MEMPPSITPSQMNLLRAIAAMAWADGQLEPKEIELMLTRLSDLFAVSGAHHTQLLQELRSYLEQKLSLEEVIPKLHSDQERELVLKLGYGVIACSARTPDEPNINDEEAVAYQSLKALLNLPAERTVPTVAASALLPAERVAILEAEAQQELACTTGDRVDAWVRSVELYGFGK
jgi:tellurite resistance protein